MAAGWRHTSAVITGPNVSAVIQSAARLERGRTLNNGRGGEGEGRAGQGGEGRGGDWPHFPQTNHGCRVAPH